VTADRDKVELASKFALFDEPWRPKVVAELNGQEVKLVKARGTFPWHAHDAADEMFLVWRGRLRVEFRDRAVDLGPGEFVVVPRGVEHRTASDDGAEVLVFEPTGVRNTGEVSSDEFTAPNGVRL
jgi:mannose-6-phosphate isomerase-like protein (cupin superfamily)